MNKPTEEQIAEYNKLVEENGGQITYKQIVEFAKDENTALHSVFIWDESKAAYKYWIEQAREFVSNVRISMETPDGYGNEMRVTFDVQDVDGEHLQANHVAIAKNPDYSNQVIAEALQNVIYWTKEYERRVNKFGSTMRVEFDISKYENELERLSVK